MSSSPKNAAVPPPPQQAKANDPDRPAPQSKHKKTMVGLFGKASIPPPPAGRAPAPAAPAPQATPQQPTPAPELPHPPPRLSAPELPAGIASQVDPIADLFTDGPAATPAPPSADPPSEPTPGADATPAARDVAPPRPSADPSAVARLELAKTMLHGVAEEVVAPDVTRDPRADPSRRMKLPPTSLEAAVFDPDQSVARGLGQAPIDGALGQAADDSALRDLPPPQVPMPMVATATDTTLPARSMRPAALIIILVLLSGAIATWVSLGVLGGPPSRSRTAAAAPAQLPSKPVAPVVAAPAPAPPAPSASVKPAAPEPAPVAAPTPSAPAVAAAPALDIPTPVAAPVLSASAPEPAVVAEPVAPQPVAEPAPAAAAPAAEVPTTTVSPATGSNPVAEGDALLRAGNLAGAAERYQAALTADARDHYAMEGMARVELARGNGKQALSYAEQIVKRRPKRASYRVLLGQARAASGDREGARTAYQEALAIEPDNRDAQRLLAQ